MDSVGNAINTANGVKDTFSSWDKCMSKTYCKWPVIVAIIVGSLIVLSLIWCCARCLCCGAECCCGCLACCNACCPSPRGGRKDKGYHQGPPTSHQYQPPPPMYAGRDTGYAGQNTGYYGGGGGALAAAPARNLPKTAIFEERSKPAKVNEDALPAMPSWDDATKRRVEEPPEETDDVEMDKLQPSHAQQEVGLLTGAEKNGGAQNPYGYNNARDEAGNSSTAGGLRPQHASPYQDYAATKSSQLPYPSSGYSSAQNIPLPASPSYYSSPQDARQPTAYPYSQTTSPQNPYHSASTVSGPYASRSDANIYPSDGHYSPPPHHQQQSQQSYPRGGYEPSIAAPSYRTHDVVSPVSSPSAGPSQSQQYQPYGQSSSPPSRKPVVQQYGQQPNWREI